jgi:hypothetical protein
VPRDQLIGNTIEVLTDNLRLRADVQDIVSDPLDQRSLPASRNGAKRVPGMASDKTKLGSLNPKLPLDIGVSLTRRLMMLYTVRAERRSKSSTIPPCSS